MNLLLTKIPLFPIWPERVEIDGVKIPVRDSPLSRQMRRRLMKGLYEAAERQLVKAFIQPGDQILELGASIGIVTCYLAKSGGQNGKIVSVEPNSSLRDHFEKQLRLNDIRVEFLHALCCPLWKQPVPTNLASKGFLSSESSLSGRITESRELGNNVRWITAEQACSETRLEPTAVVADIEGTEAVWAEYSPHFPESLRTIILEIHPHLIGIEKAGRVVQVVLEEGFRVVGFRNNVIAFERA